MNNYDKNEYMPDFVSPPGDTLEEILSERGMSQAELSERMGRPTKTINEIVKGKAAITPETALQLERVLGVKADFWNQVELSYRAFLAKIKEDQKLQDHVEWFKKYKFPVKNMIKFGWLPDIGGNRLVRIRELLNFYSVSSESEWEKIWLNKAVAFRRSDKIDTKTGPTSAWLRQGEIAAGRIECAEFSMEGLKSSLNELRDLTLESNPDIFIPEIERICSKVGVAVVFLPAFSGIPISGVSQWLNSKKAMVLLSLRHKSDDHLWFTLFHELSHIILHNKKQLFVDFSEKNETKSKEENEADNFASELLIPNTKLNRWLYENPMISEKAVKSFACGMGISPGIVVGRLHHIGRIAHSRFNQLKRYYAWDDAVA